MPLGERSIVLVGPTAVGKSALALRLAERLGGEIVSADSMAVYRGMDVGTAKPTPAERARVPHHLIDLVDPDEEYSVARFLDDAARALGDVEARARWAIVAGGAGYWVRALLGGGTSADVPPDAALRAELAGLSAPELADRLHAVDPTAKVDTKNPRRVIRAIEVVTATGQPYADARRADARVVARRVVGLTLPRDELYRRIDARYDAMMAAGFLDEVRGLVARYGRDVPPMRGLGYRELAAHLAGETSLQQALDAAKTRCRRYARGQYAWFRLDDPSIMWVDAREDAREAVLRSLGE